MHTQHHRGDKAYVSQTRSMGPTVPLPLYRVFVFFIRCTIRNQDAILKTAVADVSKGQTDMSYKGELQILTKLSMRHQVCPSETRRAIKSESILTMLMKGT